MAAKRESATPRVAAVRSSWRRRAVASDVSAVADRATDERTSLIVLHSLARRTLQAGEVGVRVVTGRVALAPGGTVGAMAYVEIDGGTLAERLDVLMHSSAGRIIQQGDNPMEVVREPSEPS